MILLDPEHIAALTANTATSRAAQEEGKRDPDHVPVVKLFNPIGAATWLATELLEDGDTLFGLADLGFGCPELGYFSLNEISQVRLPFGLRVERDIGFGGIVPLSKWAETARAAGSIIHAQALIRAIAEKDGPAPAGDKPSE
ncbi:DUF2958 domain-containing protein [Sphingobium yanoikuyae]|uniref:DUF2958 domain-containing protein n=1 Tax=Sphingobium yanoikuyae TaxID=13690 RepID=A0AA42WYM4_SPHYA|nr:DUF2958 domain-containing protein [Sphingobium yanoikuyae]MDH2132786.1 DUF2958 domain-containing protein [Sphingobium yanoikuyae]MDH2151816.1 DUF2958 domain-containing protein [Sphingobium yanoikuyae]MDH2167963.1 DUF2958 domain-containing protein [Sphingobium yanoikuyae]